jgi:cysteinyl-tRNA synthetase
VEEALRKQVAATRQGFLEAMDDDFNTAGALGYLFELVRAINLARDAGVGAGILGEAAGTLRELAGVMGLRLDRSDKQGGKAAPFVDLMIEIRSELRRQKLWGLADQVRKRLAELGVILEDSKEGTTWRWE